LRCHDIIGKFLQGRAQPSLGLPLFLALALVCPPNPGHFRNEGFDDPVNFLPDEHREPSHWSSVSIPSGGNWFTTDPPSHQMVLEGSAPLSSNVPMEIFVLPSDRYRRSSYRRTFMLTFGRRIGLSIGEYRITFVVAIRAACAAAMQLSRWKPKTRAREPETTMSVCNCAREH
jgi:hypothetical protein